jgi:hypothetical protein
MFLIVGPSLYEWLFVCVIFESVSSGSGGNLLSTYNDVPDRFLGGNAVSEMQTQGGCAVGRQVTVPPISTNTLRFCVAKLTSTDASVSPDEELHFASADQVVELARNRGWGATFIQVGWSEIRNSLGVTGFNLWSMFVAIIGAIIVLVVYHAIRRAV